MEITRSNKNYGQIEFYSNSGFKELFLKVRTDEYDEEDWDFIRNLYFEIRTYISEKYKLK